jgi:hypothetical protein
VLPIKGSQTAYEIKRTCYNQLGGGPLSISDGLAYLHRFWMHDSVFRADQDNDFTAWLGRWFGLDGIIENSSFLNCPREHPLYIRPGRGDLTFRELLIRRAAANAIQLRMAQNDNSGPPENDPDWDFPRTITFDRVVALECGMARGAGRAAFSLSPKSPGPNSLLRFNDIFVQTVRQKNVDGKGHDSFGGLCVEECQGVEGQGGVIELANPANGGVQMYEFDVDEGAHQRCPPSIVWDGLTCENTFNIRVDHTPYVRLSGFKGNGHLVLWRWQSGDWRPVLTQSIGIPYSHG